MNRETENMAGATILIGGDICPRGGNVTAFDQGDVESIFGFLLPELAAADFVVANLECPLADRDTPIVKTGPRFRAPPATARTLKAAGIDAVTLANNHIMDQGGTGLESTLRACSDAGLKFFGAGRDLAAASVPLEVEIDGISIAFVGLAEHEFSIAGPDSWGAAPLDVMDFVRFMRGPGARYDHVIVLLHGGTEHYPLPSPRFRRTCQFLVEQGASAVICQHSHHIGPVEVVDGAPIVYGQGNFVFENRRASEEWHKGYLVRLHLTKDKRSTRYDLIPFRQLRDGVGLRDLTSEERVLFEAELESYSKVLADPREFERRWVEFCERRRRMYFSLLRGHSRLVRGANRILGFAERLFPRRAVITLLALFRCEAHHEAVVTLLESRYRKYFHHTP